MVARAKKAWYLANTTIRNAKRIKDGLATLVASPLHGNLEGRSRERQFADLFQTAFAKKAPFDHKKIEEIIIECINKKVNADAPQWKQKIKDHVLMIIQQIRNNVI
ncbi:MAG TPA: hypothetical protein VKY19_26695 [Ktedonosporobacter sp.]|jgi:hypothetical protein|nr:hypothetical protein [Ktedonosporobacter sp.]